MSNTAHAPFMPLHSGALAVQRRGISPVVAITKLDVELSLTERASVLEAELARALASGAQLESRTTTVAVLVYRTSSFNHIARLLVTFMRLGLGLFARAETVADAKSSRILLTVDEYGSVTRLVIPC